MSDFEYAIFAYALAACFLAMIMYLVFSWVTVRKLRKNPDTKDKLGMEFMSGWDVFNVAQALSTPRSIHKILESNSLAFLHADTDELYKHINRLDRVLAIIFWFLFITTAAACIVLVVLSLLD